jgi:hypothetical protein
VKEEEETNNKYHEKEKLDIFTSYLLISFSWQ